MKNFFIGYLILCICSYPFIVSHSIYMILFESFLYGIAYKDYTSYYVNYYFIPVSILFLIFSPFHTYFSILSGLFGCVGLYFYKKKGLGSMDVYFLFYFGLYLGYERMVVAIGISTILGILYGCIKKEKLIPYVSCLSIGVWISLLKGYTLYSLLFHSWI